LPGNDRQIRRDSLEAETSKRLAAIVAAAEQAATKVIDDAEREAQRQLADARAQAEALAAERLSALAAQADSLIAQAEQIRQRSEQLLAGLARFRSDLDGEDAGWSGYEPQIGARAPHLSAVAPAAEPAPAEEEEEEAPRAPALTPLRGERESPAGARLLATQMAVSGSSREEIASRLRNGFEIDDPEPILDAILGPEA
jgi:vacuolar-type H+-ATPase subunit H